VRQLQPSPSTGGHRLPQRSASKNTRESARPGCTALPPKATTGLAPVLCFLHTLCVGLSP
jgi:hypothetical protein